ncbi:phage GP46 family protein [Xanthomonas sp. MUS 060]|uniref:phage GP46 family protein n=1 Tax=Xanthomonas sp. MUS 060 TaxID=1588031 RepID=UPI001F21F62B|nr:phage GP46 family protein [Xanthomonas sp. MUS 060]
MRAVLISLFTWRRANADDTPCPIRVAFAWAGGATPIPWWPTTASAHGCGCCPIRVAFAWAGGATPIPWWPTTASAHGCGCWQARAKLTPSTVQRAQDYAEEALQWLIDDGVAARIAVRAERQGLSTLALQCTLFAADGTANAVLRFDNLWSLLNV